MFERKVQQISNDYYLDIFITERSFIVTSKTATEWLMDNYWDGNSSETDNHACQ